MTIVSLLIILPVIPLYSLFSVMQNYSRSILWDLGYLELSYPISNSDVIHRQKTIERNVNVHFLNDAVFKIH